jgi:hypothetical protein
MRDKIINLFENLGYEPSVTSSKNDLFFTNMDPVFQFNFIFTSPEMDNDRCIIYFNRGYKTKRFDTLQDVVDILNSYDYFKSKIRDFYIDYALKNEL